MRYILLLIVTFLLSGCFTPVTSLDEWSKTTGNDVDIELRRIFTAEAYEAIKEIPIYRGPIGGGGMAAGTTTLSHIPGLFNGVFGRAVILSNTLLNHKDTTREDILDSLVHEYVHHLHDLTLDGEANFITGEEFASAYSTCFRHRKWHGITVFTEANAPAYYMDTFGIGDRAEYIAYTAQIIYKQGCTPSLRRVFSRILRTPPNAVDYE